MPSHSPARAQGSAGAKCRMRDERGAGCRVRAHDEDGKAKLLLNSCDFSKWFSGWRTRDPSLFCSHTEHPSLSAAKLQSLTGMRSVQGTALALAPPHTHTRTLRHLQNPASPAVQACHPVITPPGGGYQAGLPDPAPRGGLGPGAEARCLFQSHAS